MDQDWNQDQCQVRSENVREDESIMQLLLQMLAEGPKFETEVKDSLYLENNEEIAKFKRTSIVPSIGVNVPGGPKPSFPSNPKETKSTKKISNDFLEFFIILYKYFEKSILS